MLNLNEEPPIEIHQDPPPIRIWEGGAVRVGKTRVSLMSVIFHYKTGRSPEEIVESFPSLELADIYATIAYYLRHKDEVDAFLEWEEEEGARIQAEMEAKYPTTHLREKLRRFREEQVKKSQEE